MQKKFHKNTTNKCTKQTDVKERTHVPSSSCLKFLTYLLKLVTVEGCQDIIGRKKVKVVN